MEGKEICLPGWKIVRTIGKGGFGKVYEVEKEDAYGESIRSALKVISIPESDSEVADLRNEGYDRMSMTELFKSRVEDITSEFRLMNKLKGCSNIVSFEDYSIVQHNDDPGYDVMIRMELLTSLPEYIYQHFENKQITDEFVRKTGIDICNALELCRECKVIHRDIKPQNIFVNAYGSFKLGDFGIAKASDHTTRATKTGTFGYMAPEVYLSKPYNASVDIYSLGLVMYWMLNERRGPFLSLPSAVPKPSDNAAALERRMAGEPLPAPKHGSEELQRIVLKACAADPKERYANPTQMKRDLERLSFEAAAEESPAETERAFFAEEDEKTFGVFGARSTETEEPAGEEEEKTVGVFGAKPIEPKKPEPTRTETPVKAAEKKNPIPVRQDEDDEKTIGVFAARRQKTPEPAGDDEATVSIGNSIPARSAEKPVDAEPERKEKTARQEPEKTESKQTEKPQKKKSKLWIVIAAAAALLAAAAVSIVLIFGRNEKPIPAADTSVEAPEETGKWLMTRITRYSADGSIRNQNEYEYDSDGKLTKYTYVDNEYGYEQWHKFEYDANGNQIKSTNYNADGSVGWWAAFEYDANGNQIRQTDFDADGNISWWAVYEYDANGNQIKWTDYNADGSISGWGEYEYDTDGKPLKYTYFNADGSINRWYEDEYDSDGNWIKETTYNADGSISGWSEAEYDDDGKTRKQTRFNADGSINNWMEYDEYDANGNVIKYTEYNADGSVSGWTEYEWLYCNPLTAKAATVQQTNVAASEAEATADPAGDRLLLAETVQLIYEAGDGGYEENDFYSKEMYDSYWAEIKKAWMNACREIIDYVGEHYSNDAYVKGYFHPDLSVEDIAANDGLKIAYGMRLWGFGQMRDGLFTDGVKTWDLVNTYPTVEDFYETTYRAYEGNVDAFFATERVVTSYDPSAHDLANTSFVNRWIGGAFSDEPEVSFQNPAIERNFRELYGVSGTIYLSNVLCITHLNSNLDTDRIYDISDVAMFRNLTNLNLADTQISDITALSGLTKLTALSLDNTQVSDISALSGMTNLTDLNLNHTKIKDLSALSGLTHLESLLIVGTQVRDISALSGLTKLTNLSLVNTQVSDISALSGLTNLEDLYLSNTQIKDVSALSGMNKLDFLYLANTQISDVSALSGLTTIRYLYLANTQVSDVSALAGLENLSVLDLQGTKVTWEQISALQQEIPGCNILY